MQALPGVVVLLGLAWALSEGRRSRPAWRLILVGLALQASLAFLLLRLPLLREALHSLNSLVEAVEAATRVGASFAFGHLGGAPPPFEPRPDANLYIFAFRVLPQIMIFSVLVAVFWHWRLLPLIIRGFGALLRRLLGVSGPVGTAAGASLFVGHTESPLIIRAYLAHLSRSELFSVMTCGMATLAGSIMVLYAGVLRTILDGALGHILVASVLNVIGAIVISRIMIPTTSEAPAGAAAIELSYSSTLDAIAQGTVYGLRLAINVGAMLVVLVSLVALVNLCLAGVSIADAPLTLERLFGWLFAPVAWLMGIAWEEAPRAGSLLGVKLVLNELIAYLQLAAIPAEALSDHSRLILTYALCSFANLGSVGILIGGFSVLIPQRRDEVLDLASKALISGTLTTCLTATLVGLVTRL